MCVSDLFIVFSSTSSLFGLKSGMLYAAANSCLDSFASHHRAAGKAGMSLQWGAWTGLGMAMAMKQTRYVAGGVTRTIGDWAMQAVLSICPGYACLAVADMAWDDFLMLYDNVPSMLSAFATSDVSADEESPVLEHDQVVSMILVAVHECCGEHVGRDDELMAGVMDSLAATELRGILQQQLKSSVKLESSLLFEFPTVAGISQHISILKLSNSTAEQQNAAPLQVTSHAVTGVSSIALIGIACRLAGHTEGPIGMWSSLLLKTDHVTRSPPERWKLACSGAPTELLTGAFFNVLNSRNLTEDPHFTCLCDMMQQALNDAEVSTEERRYCGVYTAAQTSDFVKPMPTYIVARAVAGRLRTQGAYNNIEAVCSSGYLAINHAANSITDGVCELAVADGVSLMLKADWAIGILQANIMSPTGVMRPLDASANGAASPLD